MLKSFTVSFLILVIPLLLNLLMVHIVFAGGTCLFIDPESIKVIPSMAEQLSHPMFYNLLCIFLFSFLGAFVGSGATALAMAFPNRFILYPLEYPLSKYFPGVILVLAINVIAVLFSFFKVTKYDQV